MSVLSPRRFAFLARRRLRRLAARLRAARQRAALSRVAVSSLPVDLAVKAPLYASAGIAEYWVLDLNGRRAIVHREPGANGYAQRFEVLADGQLVSTALPLPPLQIAEALFDD